MGMNNELFHKLIEFRPTAILKDHVTLKIDISQCAKSCISSKDETRLS